MPVLAASMLGAFFVMLIVFWSCVFCIEKKCGSRPRAPAVQPETRAFLVRDLHYKTEPC